MKKTTSIIKDSSNSNNEVSFPPSEEELYIVLKATPKNDQQLICFAKAKQQVPNSTKSFSIFLKVHLLMIFLCFFRLLELSRLQGIIVFVLEHGNVKINININIYPLF
jgi:hypothetical protein